jgi:hypothetical protein
MPDSHNALCEFPSIGALALDGDAGVKRAMPGAALKIGKVPARTEPYCRVDIPILRVMSFSSPLFRRCIK